MFIQGAIQGENGSVPYLFKVDNVNAILLYLIVTYNECSLFK